MPKKSQAVRKAMRVMDKHYMGEGPRPNMPGKAMKTTLVKKTRTKRKP